ncbi:alkylhydroperoxidase AhpD family core domain-containing protein [Gracilibacillus ureilyticus]|uniref:Alkylhydroperoxidase AhpD family core domain-containing protein n=1 Tax=Gracilibacillus ureilyticus TaxID=531814 RepID=A0A1H9NJT8_9BACI|nr:carboxymuconolactone decarboxylase family protein [Gracilibacillus ureilyticus]SER35919.1 alkylhydroperoxidase AhpD family core domain-containing protein [Gracilibacillus ureilyticus]
METSNYFDQAIEDYKRGTSRMKEHLPDMTKGYFHFTEEAFREGTIDQKSKQLMALAISIYAQDEYCIIYHTKGAVEHGASETEIMETLAISAALGGGAAFAQAVTLAMDTYTHYQQTLH